MELINYEELIESGFCSQDFISFLCESHSDNDVQIFLSIITEKYSVDELSSLLKIPKDEIKSICRVFYDKYYKGSDEKSDHSLGWLDSGRHRNNSKMGSYKGY